MVSMCMLVRSWIWGRSLMLKEENHIPSYVYDWFCERMGSCFLWLDKCRGCSFDLQEVVVYGC